jgi:hypothetical protein
MEGMGWNMGAKRRPARIFVAWESRAANDEPTCVFHNRKKALAKVAAGWDVWEYAVVGMLKSALGDER